MLALLGALAALPALPAGGAAQGQVLRQISGSLDVGGATVAYDDFLRSSVASVTPTLRVESARTTFLARGSYARFESGNESIQGTLAGSVVSPAFWHLRGEVFGTVSTTRYRGLSAASNLYTLGRLHWATPAGGVWGGTALGAVTEAQFLPDELVQLEAGAWRRIGRTVYTLSATPTRIGQLDYTDVTLALRWQHPDGEFVATGGYRAGARADGIPGAVRWVEAWGTRWVAERVAVVGGLGVFPADLLQGLPGGRYASAALRVVTRRPVVDDPAVRAELTLPYELSRLRRPRGAGAPFTVEADPDGTRTIRVRLPAGARRVELMADFTDWIAIPLSAAADGSWIVSLFVAPGVHRVNVRVDGGEWRAPPGLPAVRDEFGGEVGVLVVR